MARTAKSIKLVNLNQVSRQKGRFDSHQYFIRRAVKTSKLLTNAQQGNVTSELRLVAHAQTQ